MIIYNGATGSLGQYMERALLSERESYKILTSRLERPDLFQKELNNISPGSNITFIILAAMVPVSACEDNPEQAYNTNVHDTVKIATIFTLWAQKQFNNVQIIFVSTGHVYGLNSSHSLISEDHPTVPHSVYAQSKLEAENRLRHLCKHYRIKLLITRVFSVIAPNQPSTYLLPGIIRRILNRKLEDIPGLDNIRDFLDSRDVCSMLVTLALLPKTSTSLHEVINLCSGKGTSIREIVNTILQQSDQENSEYITQRFNKQNDSTESISRLIGSNVKIRELVGNTVQKIPITETIKEALSLEKNR